ncbi:MAG TPA: PilZ domain-containing protein [Deltaproteobacteria bacterium]|nr:PilZ domain-containing protein [Deltaproteobacteria bacterium]HPJ93626.1 PilZ domain-containing protein [Deltaproteobacteria bacterium]HPR50999.1 PilZ domain-containing protein [Deltaproteobacteria bacterium]
MEEQRAHKRARVNMKVAYRDNGFAYRIGRVSNISRGGMFINTDDPPGDVEGYIIASLDAEEFGKIIWTQGRVVRRTDLGIGILFTRTDERGLNTLLSYQGVPL